MKKIHFSILTNSFRNCFDYLFNKLKEDGSFIYQIDSDTGILSKQYNILRHCGSIYSLCQSINFNIYKWNEEFQVIEKGINYLIDRCFTLEGGKSGDLDH